MNHNTEVPKNGRGKGQKSKEKLNDSDPSIWFTFAETVTNRKAKLNSMSWYIPGKPGSTCDAQACPFKVK